MIKARVRAGASWMDACILNIGERGLGLQAPAPPRRGTYVELRSGAHVIVGCVAWSNRHRFGVRTQDRLPVDSITAEAEARTACRQDDALTAVDLRPPPRPLGERGERSRQFGRALEFTVLAALGLFAAVVTFQTVQQALAQPMSGVTAALNSG